MTKSGIDLNTGKNNPLPAEQDQHLLRTKLYIPPVRPNQINRPRLSDLMKGGLDKALILVSAPAGYGKTTLVSNWLRESQLPTAWLSLDDGDNDPIRFLQYLCTALLPIAPGIQGDLPGRLQGIQPAQFESVINILANEMNSILEPFVLVLDDFHVIHSQADLKMLSHLLEHLPPQAHLAILTRSDPPLPLARLRSRGQLLDIRADQLRFTHAEVAAFLNDAMKLALSAGDLTALEARTEGWIAGLQLAALSMQASKDIHGFVSAFTGSHHYVMDYLVEEVLKLQPKKVSTFLLQTSILDRMCGKLCEAVVSTDEDGPANGQAMLESLEEMNLFTVPLDDERHWYRYHHLFADVLRKRLESRHPKLPSELHRRASQWYEQNGFITESIQQAIEGGDADRAAQLIEGNGCFLLISGEVTNFLSWSNAIEFKSDVHPWLAIQKGWALALDGYLDQVEATLQLPDKLLASLEPSPEIYTMKGTIAAARAYCANSRGDTRTAEENARLSLELLPDCSSISQSIRSVATSLLGDASRINGNLEEAIRAYTEAVRIGQAAGNPHMVIIAQTNLADVFLEQGQLRRAASLYSRSLEMALRPDGQRSPLAAPVYTGLGLIAYEQNRLEEAARNIQLCLDLCRKWHDPDRMAAAYAILARIENARNEPEAAQKAARESERISQDLSFVSQRSSHRDTGLAASEAVHGEEKKQSRLVGNRDLSPEADIPYQRQPEYLILLREFYAKKDYRPALALSKRLLRQAELSGRKGLMIEVLILQALIFQGIKEMENALAVLETALSLAEPEEFVRSFLDGGEAMTRLLCQFQARQVGSGYAAELLSRIGSIHGMTPPSKQLLIEPLTAREIEVLKLIESGCSNQDIAGKLVVSIPTVKRHISNIYAKLGVESRTQAVALGKELKMLG